MTLIERYSKHNLVELITILEAGDDYTEDARAAIRTILEFKNPDKDEIKQVAISLWEERVNANIKTILLQNQKPRSEFLSEEEMKKILLNAFEMYREKLELFEINTSKYWFV